MFLPGQNVSYGHGSDPGFRGFPPGGLISARCQEFRPGVLKILPKVLKLLREES